MRAFRYHRPTRLEEARALMEGAEEGRYLAGGQTLLPAMTLRLSAPSDVIDLSTLPGLAALEEADGAFRVGALVRHAEVAEQSPIAALGRLAGLIGDPHVRNRGTLGGSLANSDPAADYPAAVLGLGAEIVTDRRTIAADAFFRGLFETALEPSEIIAAVRFPKPRRAAYAKFPHPASRFALVGVFVAELGDTVRVAVTGAGPCAFRVLEMERALSRIFAPGALEGIALDERDLNEDIHAGAEYRAHLIAVMAKRAVAAALAGGRA